MFSCSDASILILKSTFSAFSMNSAVNLTLSWAGILGKLCIGSSLTHWTRGMGLRYFMWVDVGKWQPNNPKSEEKGGLI